MYLTMMYKPEVPVGWVTHQLSLMYTGTLFLSSMQVCNTYSTGNMHEDFSVFHYGYLQSGPEPSLLSMDMGPEDGLSIEAEVTRLENILQGLQAEEQETIQTPHSADEAAYRLITGLRSRRMLALELELGRLQAKVSPDKSEL